MQASDFFLTAATSLGTAGLVGFLFWSWINNKFGFMEKIIDENRARIRELEHKNERLLSRDDHFEIRREDKESLEKQLIEMKKDIRDLPDKMAAMIRQLIK